jgi:hypothetical protein
MICKKVMQFLNPLVLFGLIASVIPLIIHLLNLRKVKTIEFSTLKFLNELQKSTIRKLKVKQILLLIIRTLLIIFLIFAFSRPSVKSHLPILGEYSKTSVVILLDNTFSMDISDEFGNRFNQAKGAAKAIINNLKEGDEVCIIPLSQLNANEKQGLSRNLKLVNDNLNSISISNIQTDYISSLRKVQSILDESKNLAKEIFIISDFQASNFSENKDSLKFFDNNTMLYYIPIGANSKTDIQNLSIDSLKIGSSIFQVNKPIEVDFAVNNLTSKALKGIVASNFLNNQKLSQRAFDIEANESVKLNLSSVHSNPGLYKGYLEIENDALDQDNKRFFGFILPEKPKSAIIGSEKSIKYLKIILNLDGNELNPTEIFSNREISSVDLSKFDVVYFTGPFSKNDLTIIKQFSDNGGGAFVFANSETNPEIFAESLKGSGIRDIKKKEINNSLETGIKRLDKLHPLFANVFKNPADEKLQVESPKFSKFLEISGGQSIIDIENGSLLTELRGKSGKIIIMGAPPNEEWSNIAKSSIFPTIVYRSLYYLSSKELRSISICPQYNYLVEIPSKLSTGGNFKLIAPDNTEAFYSAAAIGDKSIIQIQNLLNFGNYVLYNSQNQIISILSVNPNKEESRIGKYDSKVLKENFSGIINNNVLQEEISDYSNINKSIIRAKSGTELWQLFVILAIIMAIGELLVQRLYKNE